MRYVLFTILFAGCFEQPYSSINNSEMDHVLSSVEGKSEKMLHDRFVQQIIKEGNSNLQSLIDKFPDTTLSNVYSNCCNRYLSRGELAIIIADHIEKMPYFLLTGIQNCTMTFCPDNPNNIEYYLDVIKSRRGVHEFTKKYRQWVNSKKQGRDPIYLSGN